MAAFLIVGREQLQAAMVEFDKKFRDLPEWTNWEANAAQTFAIVQGSKRYSPKKIISQATCTEVDSFSGGHQSNSYFKALGFEVILLGSVDVSAQP